MQFQQEGNYFPLGEWILRIITQMNSKGQNGRVKVGELPKAFKKI
jgi:hypothetical protein